MSLLGIDMGTSSCKAVISDENGTMLAHTTRDYAGYAPRTGWYEMDPTVFWYAAVEAINEVSAIVSDPVQAISVSSQGETFVPVDSDNIPLGPAIMNSDNRARDEVDHLENQIGRERIFSITGGVLHPMYSLPKIMWFLSHSASADKAAKFLSVGDYILSHFDMPPITDCSLASRTLAFNVTERQWSDEILLAAGVSKTMFPEIIPSGTEVGKIQRCMAETLGIPIGTIVAVGGHDQPAGALGAGVLDECDTVDSAGSYECLAVVSKQPLLSKEAFSYNLNSYCHVLPDRYVTLAFFPAGIAFQWVVEQLSFMETIELIAKLERNEDFRHHPSNIS